MSAFDDQLLEQLDALLDGALDEPAASELRARIEAEPALRAEYARRRRTVELVRELPDERPAGDFLGETLARLPAAAAADVPEARVPLLYWGGGLAAAAAILIAFFLGGAQPGVEPVREAREKPDADDPAIRTLIGDAPLEKSEKARAPNRKAAEKETPRAEEDELRKAVARERETAQRRQRRALSEVKRARPESKDRGAAGDDSDAVDVEESAEARATPQPADAPGKANTKLGKAAPTGRREAELDALVKRVESKEGPLLKPSERVRYLQRLERMPAAELRAHFGRVGAGARVPVDVLRDGPAIGVGGGAGGARAKSTATTALTGDARPFELAVERRSEADGIRTILARALRTPRERGGAKGTARGNAGPTPSTAAADSMRDGKGVLTLDCAVTPEQAGALAVWISRLGLRARESLAAVPQPGSSKVEEAKVRKKAAPQPVPIVVRIRFGAQTPAAERPAGEDR